MKIITGMTIREHPLDTAQITLPPKIVGIARVTDELPAYESLTITGRRIRLRSGEEVVVGAHPEVLEVLEVFADLPNELEWLRRNYRYAQHAIDNLEPKANQYLRFLSLPWWKRIWFALTCRNR